MATLELPHGWDGVVTVFLHYGAAVGEGAALLLLQHGLHLGVGLGRLPLGSLEQELGVGVGRLLEEVCRRCLLHQHSTVHDTNGIAEVAGHPQVVGDEQEAQISLTS